MILEQEAAKSCSKNDIIQDEPERVVRAVRQGVGWLVDNDLRKEDTNSALYVLCRILCDGNWRAPS